jgi:uncharacterized protein (DUF433 family)
MTRPFESNQEHLVATPTDVKYIVRDPEIMGGRPSIAGHRISVLDIAAWHQQGMSANTIAHDFGLTLAQVYAALAYYYDHQDEIDRELVEEEAEIRVQAEADTSSLAKRIRAARSGRGD